MTNFTAAEINAEIAAGRPVFARSADLPRRGQPNRGVDVRVEQAFDGGRGEIRITAVGYKGRFRAEIVGTDIDY